MSKNTQIVLPLQHNSWNIAFASAFLVMLAQVIVLSDEVQLGSSYLRIIHLVIALSSLGVLLKLKNKWKRSYSIFIFIILYLPFYFIIWNSHSIRANLTEDWVPFLSLKVHFIIVAFLVPGPYWLNLLLILVFLFEFGALWFWLEVPKMSGAVLFFEPGMTILCAVVGLFLLYFRYRDDKLIQELIHRNTTLEFYRNLSRLLLSLRDKINTPLQTQLIMIEVLKRKYPEVADLHELKGPTSEIGKISLLLKQIDKDLHHLETNPMTDSEIIEFISRFEDGLGQKKLKKLSDFE